MIGMDFAQAMMRSVLSAKTAMASVTAQRKGIAQTEGRMRILKSEIKMGTGATEAKQEELTAIQDRLETVKELQLGSLEDAQDRLNSFGEKRQNSKVDKTTDSADDNDKENEDENKTVSERCRELVEAKKELSCLFNGSGERNPFTEEYIGIRADYML